MSAGADEMYEEVAAPQQQAAPQYPQDLIQRAWGRAALDFRRAAESSLLDFVPQLDPKLIRPYHLEPLAQAIEQARREPVRMTISVPPRHGKSRLLLAGIVWLLLNDPSHLIAYISYAAQFARGQSRVARDYARTAGIIPRDDADALNEWLLPGGGGLRATGIGGPLTGQGFRTIFIDDPVKNRAEAESRIVRQRNWDWFTSTATTRLTPNGSLLVIHTRWNEDDLIGRLKRETDKWYRTNGSEGEFWWHVNLPAIADDGDGLALCPELWTKEQLLKKKRAVGAYDWSALYQGDPRPRGAKLFKSEPARYDAASLDGRRIVIGVDVAGTASTAAHWTVAVVMAFCGHGDTLRADVLEVKRWQLEIPSVCRQLEALQKRHNAPLVVEGSGIGKAVPQLLRDNNPRLRITVVYPVVDKWVRAQPYAAAWNDNRVRMAARGPAENDEFIRVHGAFTGVGDAEDDDVDAAAHAWNFMLGRVAVAPLPDSEQVEGLRMGEGRGFTD